MPDELAPEWYGTFMDILEHHEIVGAFEGEAMLIVGSRKESATFPYGFFKEWRFDMNLGRFARA